jgi:phage protein D
VISDYGLTAQTRDGVNTTTRNWMQTDETDLAFLRRVLAEWDCDGQVVSDKFQVGRIGQDQRTLVRLEMGVTLLYARMTADIAEQVSRITLGSYDPATGEAVDASGDAAALGPGTGQTGADILSANFSEVALHAGRFGPMTDGDGSDRAAVEAQRRARGFVRVRGNAVGNAALRVGSWVELVGVNPVFANQYTVNEAVHRWDQISGYLTDFVAESAHLGEPA